jgi:16S rRNA (adenine(1408)-N(1))-methyltransferase
VIIDIGTGDGHFVYQSARRNPKKLFIGVDANVRPLEKISEKIHRKPAKGGLPNALFVQAAVEDLPAELDGVADEVHVHFPWGSLLRAVASGERAVLENLRRICAPGALLEVVLGLDPEKDRAELERLGIAPISLASIDGELIPRYRAAGFEVLERGMLSPSDWAGLQTSWAKRLRGSSGRSVFYFVARASVGQLREDLGERRRCGRGRVVGAGL